MQVISICNFKGGVGKTATAAAIAQGLNARNKPKAKALLIDCDPQGTATKSCYGIRDEQHLTIYDVITGKAQVVDAIRHTDAGDVLPYSKQMANIDIEFNGNPRAYFMLREALASLEGVYTHIIIDTAPGISLATFQAMTASSGVVIPIMSSPDNCDNLTETYERVELIRKYNYNPDLKIIGVFFDMHTGRSNILKQFEDLYKNMCKAYKIPLLKTTVRRAAVVQESHALAQSLFEYAPRSNVTSDYTNLIKELKL